MPNCPIQPVANLLFSSTSRVRTNISIENGQSFSIKLSFYATNIASNTCIFSAGGWAGDTSGVTLFLSNGILKVATSNGIAGSTPSSLDFGNNTLNASQWYDLDFTLGSDNSITIRVDGIILSPTSGTVTPWAGNSENTLIIGHYRYIEDGGSLGSFDGLIYGIDVSHKSTSYFWGCEENGQGVLYDYYSNNNPIIIGGSPTWAPNTYGKTKSYANENGYSFGASNEIIPADFNNLALDVLGSPLNCEQDGWLPAPCPGTPIDSEYSDKIIQRFVTNPTNENLYLESLEIIHPDLPQVYYLVNDRKPWDFTLEDNSIVTHQPYGFAVSLPSTDQGGVKELNLAVDNTDQFLTEFIDQAKEFDTPVSVTYRVYTRDDPTTNELSPPYRFDLTDVTINTFQVSGKTRSFDMVNAAFLTEDYDRVTFPSLGS